MRTMLLVPCLKIINYQYSNDQTSSSLYLLGSMAPFHPTAPDDCDGSKPSILSNRLVRQWSTSSGERGRKLFHPFDIRVSTEQYNSIDSGDSSDTTIDVSKTNEEQLFFGAYGHLRKKLDYTYHSYYRKERQWLHDSIIEDFLDYQDDDVTFDGRSDGKFTTQTTPIHDNSFTPWLILSVGVQGAGKHYTINNLVRYKRLRLNSFVNIAPDDIRHYFPEYSTYVAECPEKVDKLTRKEAGYIAETLVLAALQAGRNVILHSQLRDVNWYRSYIINFLRPQYTSLKVAILLIEADHEIIQDRTTRARQIINDSKNSRSNSFLTDTENVYDSDEEVEASLRRIPQAVLALKPIVDFCCVIHNKEKDEPKLVNENDEAVWDEFERLFDQTSTTMIVSDDSSSADSEVARKSDRKRPRLMTITRCSRLCERRTSFSPALSTEENHRSNDNKFYGQFAHIREKMDYTYHSNYTRDRQRFQDAIIAEFMKSAVITDKNGEVCTTPTEPWLVFTAGAMGAGKSYTMNKLVKEGRFPLLAFVQVDPDAIRMYIPEYHIYVAENPEMAGKLTQKEAGYIAEMLTMAGLQSGKNVLVDGSLRNYDWYSEYFSSLRSTYSNLRISIIHVTAPAEAVFKRAEQRAKQTGRVVPRAVLEDALKQVPQSVAHLINLVDYHVELRNDPDAPDIKIVTPGETWESFSRKWIQTCAWIPSSKRKMMAKSREMALKLDDLANC